MRTHSFADLHEPIRVPVRVLDSVGSPDSLILHYSALWLHKTADYVQKRVRKTDRLFWHRVRMARFGPDLHFAVTREVVEPFRVGRAVILHLEPFKPGIAIGWYGKPYLDESEALTLAIRPQRPPTKQELDNYDDGKLHGPGKPVGLRFSATRGREGHARGPELRVVDPGDAGLGE